MKENRCSIKSPLEKLILSVKLFCTIVSLVVPVSRQSSNSDATSSDKATHTQKEYFEFSTKPPQDSVFLKAEDRAFVTPSSESSKVKFQNSLPKCQQLLNDFWIMFFLLPNGRYTNS